MRIRDKDIYFSKPVTADEAGALLEKHPKW